MDRTIKLFSYETLYQSGVQVVEFGQRFEVDADLDYVDGWDIIRVKMNGHFQSIAVKGDKKCIVMGAIVHIPEDLIDKVDEYEGSAYKRIGIITECGNDCQMYVKR
jgi:hypothetical protein